MSVGLNPVGTLPPATIDATTGGGGTSHTMNPSGGFTLGGTATIVKGQVAGPTGGMHFAGAATITHGHGGSHTLTPSGGMHFAGSAAIVKGQKASPSGGMHFAGAANIVHNSGGATTHTMHPAGGMVLRGNAAFQRNGFSPPPNLSSIQLVRDYKYSGPLVPLGYQQLTSLSSVQSLTIPTGAIVAILQAESANVRWRDDGTAPTSSVGMIINTSNPGLVYVGNLNLIKFIAASGGAILNVAYYQ